MTPHVLSVICFLFGSWCWWRARGLLERAQREREEAEVEHQAAEWYWALVRSRRADR